MLSVGIETEELAGRARAALEGHRFDVTTASDVPAVPGLYAIWADDATWTELGLTWGGSGLPLYVGKSESSLRGREVNTHFDAGTGSSAKTGSSTVRRSFAALLAESLGLSGIPRNTAKPGHFSNYSLPPADDARLTRWMHGHLQLSVWPYPPGSGMALEMVETEVIRAWDPPLNIDKAPTSRQALKAARGVLARQAREWVSASEHLDKKRII